MGSLDKHTDDRARSNLHALATGASQESVHELGGRVAPAIARGPSRPFFA
jgi:hypothetical protein